MADRTSSPPPNQQPNPNAQQSGGRRPPTSDKAAIEQSNLKTLREMFAKIAKQLEAALPRFITPERMIRVATTTVQRVPKLLQCDPITVVGSIMQSAQLGLEPDNITGSAYLVPFWNSKADRLECSLIPGYRGLMMLARRSKEITAFDARIVKDGDAFEYEYGSRQYLRHKPAIGMVKKGEAWEAMAERETVAAYMIAFYGRVPTGDSFPLSQFSVMHRPELEKAKQFTKSRIGFGPKKGEITGPWIEHPDAMFTKTVIRRGCKLLPFSIELLTAVGLEERLIGEKSQNLGALVADDLGMTFTPTDTEEEPLAGETAELVTEINALFDALKFSEARRTVKLQEHRANPANLLEWLRDEARRAGVSVGGQAASETTAIAVDTKPTASETKTPPSETKASTPDTTRGAAPAKKSGGKFRI